MLVLFVLLVFGQTASAQFGGGSGTAADPYIIHTTSHWNELVANVANGNTYEGVYFKQDAKIYPNTMVGTSDYPFQGFYYSDSYNHGMGYTLEATEEYAAPFRYVDGATISNLKIDFGQLTTSAPYAGGLIGHATGEVNVNGCIISGGDFATKIISTVEGNGSHGGFVGYQESGNLVFNNCLFAGDLMGYSTYNCGGFVGWSESDNGATVRLMDCLFTPRDVTMHGDYVFVCARNVNYVTLRNCYYSHAFGIHQGEPASGANLGGGWLYSYTPSEPINNPSNFYTAIVNGLQVRYLWQYGEPIDLNFTVRRADGVELTQGTDYNIIIKNSNDETVTEVTDRDNYTLILSGREPYVGSLRLPFSVVNLGSENNPYLIASTEDWDALANQVANGQSYSGKYFRLGEDINVTTMVGTYTNTTDNKGFAGTFDGNGHTLTINVTNQGNRCAAPFKCVEGATIKNLHTAGAIGGGNNSDGKLLVGIVGVSFGNTSIKVCISSVSLSTNLSDDVALAGIVAAYKSEGDLNVENCLFNGSMTANTSNANRCGGLVGYRYENAGQCSVSNSLFAPTALNVTTGDTQYSATIARTTNYATPTITNCYYTQTLGIAQGTDASGMSKETFRMNLGEAWENIGGQVQPIMGIHFFADGDGTEGNPYLIASEDDWNKLASNAYLGETYYSEYFKMTADISVSRMVGTKTTGSNYFRGIFDGDGHTLTFSYTAANDQAAPFRFVANATIRNLHVDGTIETSAGYAAGIAGETYARTRIENCRSSVVIRSSRTVWGGHGGIVGLKPDWTNAILTIEGCVFDGKLLSTGATPTPNCGGLVGYTSVGATTIVNSLYAPAALEEGETEVGGNATFICGSNFTITNCYYTRALGTVQGKQARSIVAGANAEFTLAFAGNETEYYVSDITTCGTGLQYSNVLYAGNGEEVSLNLIPELGYEVSSVTYTPAGGTATAIAPDEEDAYIFTMPDANVTINANVSVMDWEGEGTEDDPYRIYYPTQLDLLVTRTNSGTGHEFASTGFSGKYFKVMGNLVYDGNADNYTTIGQNENHKFNGHFDGQGYTIRGIKSTTTSQSQCNGLFGYVGSGAEVKNVTLANTTIGDGEDVGGIAGINEGTVMGCYVLDDVTITGALQASTRHGGIVGSNRGTVSNCVFEGTLTKTFSNPSTPMISYGYGGIAGGNTGALSDNLVIGATIPATMHYYGAIAGSNGGTKYLGGDWVDVEGVLERNYYVNCTVAGNATATGVGCFNHTGSSNYTRCDVTVNDGAVPGYLLTLGENITSDALTLVIPAHGETEEVTYTVTANGNTITLGYELPDYEITYYVNEEAIEGNTFTMPDTNVTITATAIEKPCGIVLDENNEWVESFDNVTTSTPAKGFTGATMGDCWTWNSLVELPATYVDTMPQLFYRAAFAHSDDYSLLMWHRGVYAMPELDENIDINQLKMSFYVRQPHSFYTLMVGVMDDPTEPETFEPVAYVDNGTSTAPEYFEFDFSNYDGDGRYIAFKNVRPSATSFDGQWNDIHSVNYIDDIKLSLMEGEAAACVVPVPYEKNFDETQSTNALTGITPECWEVVQEYVEDTPLEKKPMIYCNSAVAYNGNYSLRMVNRCVYALPALAANVDEVQLSMQVLQPKTRYQLEVGVWDTVNAEFVPVTLVNNTTTGYEDIVCDFSLYRGPAGRIAFRNVLGNGYDYDYSYNYIDDIKVSYKVECDEVIELGHTESFDGYTESTEALTGEEPDCWELVQQDVVMPKNKKPQLCYSGDNYYLAMIYRGVYAMPSLETGVEIQNLHLSMKLRQPNKSYRLEVGVWEPGEGSEPGVFVPVHVFNNNITETFVECDFSDYTGTGGRIAFRNTLGNGKTWDYSYNYIDDVTLDYNATEARNNASGANVIDEIGVERYLEGIAVYPNPTTGVLHIGAVDVQKVECYNQMGQLVAVYDNENNINISALAKGVYTLRITVPQGVTIRKVVKK